MLAKNHILDCITEIIVREKVSIEKKNKLGLFDDNKHWENIIRTILNNCLGYELENLNMNKSNYPGIDLGDKSNGIGIQVTTTKTSAKIINTLEKMIKEGVYEKFDSLKVFILGDKQDFYKVDMEHYKEKIHFNVNEDVWDFNDLLKFINNMNTTDLSNILEYLQEEFEVVQNKQKNNSELAAMGIINYLNQIKKWLEEIAVNGKSYTEFLKLKNADEMFADVVTILSSQEYIMLCQMFESIERPRWYEFNSKIV